jgi:DNA end-binding protein Ku
MAARAYWQGQVRLALVSIPVEIYSATRSGASIAFHQIHEPSGKRSNMRRSCPASARSTPMRSQRVRGREGRIYPPRREGDRGRPLESKKTLELTQFVDAHEIDAIYFDKPYYVVPADDLAEEAFIVLREGFAAARRWRSASSPCAAANMS